jgi:hypothetical protein
LSCRKLSISVLRSAVLLVFIEVGGEERGNAIGGDKEKRERRRGEVSGGGERKN